MDNMYPNNGTYKAMVLRYGNVKTIPEFKCKYGPTALNVVVDRVSSCNINMKLRDYNKYIFVA
jgi:hypothetical protein